MSEVGREQYSCSGTNSNVERDRQGHIMSKVDHILMSNVRDVSKGMKQPCPGGCMYQNAL